MISLSETFPRSLLMGDHGDHRGAEFPMPTVLDIVHGLIPCMEETEAERQQALYASMSDHLKFQNGKDPGISQVMEAIGIQARRDPFLAIDAVGMAALAL